MKKFAYIILLTAIFVALPARAQKKQYKGSMNVVPGQLEQIGDSLHIAIDFEMRGINVDSRKSISLTPVLVALGIKQELPAVVVKGRTNYLLSRRELALMSKKERREYEKLAPYSIVKGYGKKGVRQISYTKTIKFESWMAEAMLNIQEELYGCGAKPRLLSVSKLIKAVQLEKAIVPYEITPYLAYIQPETETVKKREAVSETFLDFAVNAADIKPDYLNNPKELKKIKDIVTEILTDKSITVKNITISGYASPEGGAKYNQLLSERRANALIDFLLSEFNYPQSIYNVEFGGENWEGLLVYVTNSKMPNKEMIISILTDENLSNEQRKADLKQFENGEPYRYMLENFYPSLRKAVFKIDYEVQQFDVDQARLVVKSHPQNLILNELYLVANTYEPGSEEFVDLFETAVKMFPHDQTANLNAASAALARKDIATAERYLKLINSDFHIPEYNNAMGVLKLLQGDFDTAKQYLNKAYKSGLTVAKSNLDELVKKDENIKAINKKHK